MYALCIRVLILDDNSENIAHVLRNIGLFGEKNDLGLLSISSNAFN